jgi:hypothetical protein
MNSGAEIPHGRGASLSKLETAFGHCHSTEDERHWKTPAQNHPSEEVLVPMRSIEESLSQMLHTTGSFALKSLKSLKSNNASAFRFSIQAFSWQTLHAQVAHTPMNSGAEKPH